MLRLRRPPLARSLRACALAAAFLAAPLLAAAQDTDQLLMSPRIDGDPRNPQRFSRPGGLESNQFGQPQNFTYQPARGAGATGFNSSNLRRPSDKKGQKAKTTSQTTLQSPTARPAPGGQGAQSGQGAQTAQSATAAQAATPQAGAAQPTGTPATPAGAPADQGPTRASQTAARFQQNQNQNQNQAQTLSQNQRQNQGQNLTQQPRAAPAANGPNASYPVGPIINPPTLPARRLATPEQDAFAPTGILVGGFLLKPAIETTGAYDSNVPRSSDAKASWYSVVAPELLINSNWSRHELTANLRGSYTTYATASEFDRPSVDAKVNGRIDITPLTRADLEGRFLVGTDNPGSPNIQVGLKRLPIFTTTGGSAGLGQRINRFEVTAKGSADRTVYQNSHFTDGSIGSNADRDYNRYAAELKTGYEIMPGARTFVEGGIDQRVHDLEMDRNGVQRDSEGHYIKGGTSFDFLGTFTGDAALGWIKRVYQDPTLPRINGLTVDSSLTWLASALTTVKLTAATRVDESTLVGVSGVFTREVTLQVDHAFRRWLIATGKFSYANDDYVGSTRDDNRYVATAQITYKLMRELWLKAEYRHEWLRSNQPANNYDADVFLLGVRLQR